MQKENGTNCNNIAKTSRMAQNPWCIEPSTPIETLHLSARSFNALSRAGITTVGMLLNTDKQMLKEIRQLGVKSIEEILGWQEKIKNFVLTKEADAIDSNAVKQERIQRLNDAFDRIPHERLDKPLSSYLSAWCGLDSKAVLSNLDYLLKNLSRISEIQTLFETVSVSYKSTTECLSILKILSTDLKSLIQNMLIFIYKNPKNERLLNILEQRHEGLTLQEIADKSGLTRERIRQLKTKGFDIVIKHLYNISIDIFMFISAERGNETIFTTKELCAYFDNSSHIEVLLYVAKMQSLSNTFVYDMHFDIFYNAGLVKNIENVVESVKSLPYVIEQEKRSAILTELSAPAAIPLKVVEIEFDYNYRLSGKVYRRNNLITTQMYEYVLEHYYPKGIRLYEDGTIGEFRRKVIEVFGKVDLPVNNRAIDARLADIAILCDRGCYIHPSHIKIEDSLIEEICEYVNNSSRIVFSFNELFEIFKEKLLIRSNIHNRYFLQGALKYFLEDRFFITRYIISKQQNTNLTEDIEEFIRTKKEVHKSEIFAEYAGITEIMLSIKVNANKNLINIGKGWYIHADKLHIEKKDYTIRKILEKHTKTTPVSTRKLLEALSQCSEDFLDRNGIKDHEKLFGVLKYMFHGEFTFSRPYVARLGTDRLSSVNVIKQHLKPYDKIKIADMVELCHNYQLYFFSIRILIKGLSDEFIRVDNETLMRVTEEIDEETVSEIAGLIMETLGEDGYMALSKIENYALYPRIGFEWNAFLLRSVVEKYLSDTINVVDIYTTDTYAMNSILVDPQLEIGHYEALIYHVLKTRHNKKSFAAVSEAMELLQKQGLILGNPSKFLLDGSMISANERGKVVIAEIGFQSASEG